jgi:hypothetical protein
MKRLAIYVEGQTEQLFVAKLLKEIAGEKNIYIEQQKGKYGKKKERKFTVITASSKTTDQKYYVLIRDSGGDGQVKSDIREHCEFLAERGYLKILGLRDVFPAEYKDIPKILQVLKYAMPTKYIPIQILLAIMEIEAWFLAETSHFAKIDSSLTIDVVKNKLGIDPSTQEVETISNPAKELYEIYQLAGCAYNKRKDNCERTVEALDYSNIYVILKDKINGLGKFIDEIDSFLV